MLVAVTEALLAVPAGGEGPNGDGFTIEAVQTALEPLPEKLELGAGKVFQPIRVSITNDHPPGIFESVAALPGRDHRPDRSGPLPTGCVVPHS